MRVAIIGGGAAGFFSAIAVKENFSDAEVTIFEKNIDVLQKVEMTGGGRCNLTNNETKGFVKAYPRGERLLKKAFQSFNHKDTMRWFEERGVPLVVQKEDSCVFPKSQNSRSIIDCLMYEAKALSIKIRYSSKVTKLTPVGDNFELIISEKEEQVFDKVIVTTGGSPKHKGLEWLEKLGHKIETPVPSLFTFKMPTEKIRSLMGVVVENALVKLQGTKLKAVGPLLITHWGMSGPSILKLSSFGARILNDNNYEFKVSVNWLNKSSTNDVLLELQKIILEHGNKKLANYRPYLLPNRLWLFLLEKIELSNDKIWKEIGKKGINKLLNILTNDIYSVSGKTSFKEEFVTCGGVSLSSINSNTLESKLCPNLYLAGEVLDIDGITGGYNLQAAWTTGFVAGRLE
jgi:predicted Rossmann fold flavoprotein